LFILEIIMLLYGIEVESNRQEEQMSHLNANGDFRGSRLSEYSCSWNKTFVHLSGGSWQRPTIVSGSLLQTSHPRCCATIASLLVANID